MKLVKECILLNFSIFCFIFLFAETRERSLKHNQWSEDYNKNNTAIISPPKQVKSHITSKSEQRNESLKKNFLIDVDNHLSSTNPQKKNKPSFNLDISKQTSSAFLKDSHKNGRHRRHLRTLERARTYEKPMFTNTFAMKLSGGETVAKEIAQNYELKLVRRIFDDYFLFKHNSVCRRCKRAATRHLKKWTHDNRIEWVEQQQLLIRQKRQLDPDLPEIIYDKAVELPQVEIMDNSIYYRMNEQETAILDEVDMNFNDPFYHDQWYLHNRGQIGYPTENDMNILPVWKAGYTGSGIHLAVLDDGVHPENPEIAKNYDHSISFDFVDMKDLDHQSTVNSSHGTSCASIIAAVANNSICGVGVAYEAKVGGTKILDGPVTDAQEALALTHALHIVDIYSASWGPSDNGRHLAGPGELAEKAFIRGVTQGRKGKGAIYVWAVGNGGKKFDNCNADGYASSIFTIATGALTDEGLSAYYSETCASVLASTYVGGSHKPPTRETFQRDRRKIKVVVPAAHGKCLESFQGTSAAAPMAAGIIALILQSNPNLTWRDVQHIIVQTARVPVADEEGWAFNGAGHHFHHKVGFGVMDAARMIYLAQNWTLVANQHQYNVPSTKETIRLTRDGSTTIGVTVDKNAMTVNNRVDHLEHVLATVNITSKKRGDMEVHLISPAGTISNVLTKRPLDTSDKGFYMWDFMSVHFWGEDPHGRWLLKVKHSGKFFSTVVIHYFSLTLYGTAENPLSEDGLPIDNSRVISRNVLSTITTSEKRLSKKVHLLPRNTSGLLEDSDSVLHNSSAFENKTLETSVDQTETTAYKSGPHFLMSTTLATPKSSPKINTHLNSKNNSILNRSFFDLFKIRALGSPRKKPDAIFQTTEPSKLRIKSNRNPKKLLPKIRSGKDRFDEVMGVSRSTLVNFLNKYTKRKHTLKRYYKCVKHPTYCRYFAYKPKKEEAVKLSSPVREYVLKDPALGYATQSGSREGKLIRKKLKRKYILEMMKRFTIYCHFLRNHDNHRLHFSSDRHIPVEQVRPYRYFI